MLALSQFEVCVDLRLPECHIDQGPDSDLVARDVCLQRKDQHLFCCSQLVYTQQVLGLWQIAQFWRPTHFRACFARNQHREIFRQRFLVHEHHLGQCSGRGLGKGLNVHWCNRGAFHWSRWVLRKTWSWSCCAGARSFQVQENPQSFLSWLLYRRLPLACVSTNGLKQ